MNSVHARSMLTRKEMESILPGLYELPVARDHPVVSRYAATIRDHLDNGVPGLVLPPAEADLLRALAAVGTEYAEACRVAVAARRLHAMPRPQEPPQAPEAGPPAFWGACTVASAIVAVVLATLLL